MKNALQCVCLVRLISLARVRAQGRRLRLAVAVRRSLVLLLVRQETFLPVQLLLGRLVDGLGLAVGDGNLPALLPGHSLAVRPGLALAGGGALHLAGERVGHPHVGGGLRLVVPDLLAVSAVDLRHDELDSLGDQLALLPGDGLAGLVASPDLVALRVCLPESDAVLLGHVLAFRQHFNVRNHFASL